MIIRSTIVELSGRELVQSFGFNTLKRFADTNNFFLFLFVFKFGERPEVLWLKEADKFLLLVFFVYPSFK